jgi:hypothetical protein
MIRTYAADVVSTPGWDTVSHCSVGFRRSVRQVCIQNSWASPESFFYTRRPLKAPSSGLLQMKRDRSTPCSIINCPRNVRNHLVNSAQRPQRHRRSLSRASVIAAAKATGRRGYGCDFGIHMEFALGLL